MFVLIICFFCPQGKLEAFLSIAGQTLETFMKFLDDEAKPQQCYNSHEHNFVLALAGVVTSEGIEFALLVHSNCHAIFKCYCLKCKKISFYLFIAFRYSCCVMWT